MEKDLVSLQSTIGNLVNSYNCISDKVDPLVEKSYENYKLKKDLKRLKFINNLSSKLQEGYDNYLKTNNLVCFEYSLCYYQKCKNFLNTFKNHVSKFIKNLVTCKRCLQ